MNPGAVEEASKVAQEVVGALRSTPVILFILLFNVIFIVVVGWSIHDQRVQHQEVVRLMVENSRHQSELLASCVIPALPPQRQQFKLQSDESKPQ